MATSPGSSDLPFVLDDVLADLASYDEQSRDEWVPGEVEAKGALAIALALREVAGAIRGSASEPQTPFVGQEPGA